MTKLWFQLKLILIYLDSGITPVNPKLIRYINRKLHYNLENIDFTHYLFL